MTRRHQHEIITVKTLSNAFLCTKEMGMLCSLYQQKVAAGANDEELGMLKKIFFQEFSSILEKGKFLTVVSTQNED